MSHYYDEQQSSPLREQEVRVRVGEYEFSFLTGSGTFSRKKLDTASRLLIQSCQARKDMRLLDLGCGWGAVGLLLKQLNPALQVTLSDVNERALALTRKNADRLGVDVNVVRSDVLASLGEFDVIMTNPPLAAGRRVCYSFIEQSHEHLAKGGSLQLVARHQKGGAMLEKKMAEVFGSVETVAKQGGFRVYKSTKS